MRKIFVHLLILLVLVAFSACSSQDANNIVSTDGSTSLEKVIGFLSEAYIEQNKDVKITYNPTGSGAGIQAVESERCDIGLSSRNLNDGELKNLESIVVAHDGIAVIVNKDNKISNLSVEDIANIYTGKIKNWQELGGDSAPVVCIGREAASGTRDGFETATGTQNKCKYSQELTSTGDVVQTVENNPNAIGYASIASVKDTVKTITVEGIEPAADTIQSGKYKLQRDFIFVIKKDKEMSQSTKDFIDFVRSGQADEYIKSAGAVPVIK